MTSTAIKDFPLIKCTPGVCGGVSCVKGTRIPTSTIKAYFELGLSTEEIIESFPLLAIEEVRQALEYPEVASEV